MFLQASVTFIIIAAFLFIIFKSANRAKLKTPIAPKTSSTDLLLMKINEELGQIRKELADKGLETKVLLGKMQFQFVQGYPKKLSLGL